MTVDDVLHAHLWQGGYFCSCGHELNSPWGFNRHLADMLEDETVKVPREVWSRFWGEVRRPQIKGSPDRATEVHKAADRFIREVEQSNRKDAVGLPSIGDHEELIDGLTWVCPVCDWKREMKNFSVRQSGIYYDEEDARSARREHMESL